MEPQSGAGGAFVPGPRAIPERPGLGRELLALARDVASLLRLP